ncbi:MAG: DUF4350 domain-containing protein [Thermoanaerobaculia bacterium]
MRGLPRNRLFLGAALCLLLGVGAVLLLGGPGEARGSSIARGPGGWLAARRYLEARGARVTLLREPLDRFAGGGVLVSAFPWQAGAPLEAAEALERHVRRGGTLILAYSGAWGNAGELVALERLGLPLDEVRTGSLNPLQWRRFTREEWRLVPAGPRGGPPVRVWAPRWAPEVPRGAEVLFRSSRGGVAAALLRRGKGRILLLPADALANARLGNPGNAGLLETLRQRLGDRWAFDEYHHGLATGRETGETVALTRALDLILAHLAALYLVALWALSRRFGPAWSDPPAVTGSTGAFLLGLGALHHRLGHHGEAAVRLLERVRELDRDIDLPAELDRRAAMAGSHELVALAREVAGRRRGGRALPAENDTQTERENAA